MTSRIKKSKLFKDYNHLAIEKKWQNIWAKKKIYKTEDKSKKKKFYILDMFPYPSGEGLHVGHPKGFIATDVVSRMKRMQNFNVLHPMGWDAFGLPAENYAIKTKTHPAVAVAKNVARYKKQLEVIGLDYDWSREINTTDPKYYKWTQWIFLKLLEKGLAFESHEPVNWCPVDKTVLANEDVEDGRCERCGSVVEKKPIRQWVLRITDYAERMLKDLDGLNWPESIKESQRNWIGKSEGAEIDFPIIVKNNKPRFVLLHGFEGHASTNFFPWLKKELEKSGYEVEVPELPHTNNPTETEQVDFVLKNCTLDENTVVVGHSLGAIVAMKAITKLGKPVSGMTLIASAVDPRFHHDSRPFKRNFNWDFDFALLKKLTSGRIAVLADTREKFRIPYLKHLSEQLGAWFQLVTSTKQHFCASQEPEILKSVTPRVKVFTTRPDTIFGATYVVLSPEHAWVNEFLPKLKNRTEVEDYVEKVKNKGEAERTDAGKEKTGVELQGLKAVNPATGEEIPMYIADYVLSTYGTGAIMAVPAHDERDHAFAKKYNLPVKFVVEPTFGKPQENETQKKAAFIILRDKKTNKAIVLDWGPRQERHGGKMLIGGGLENDETYQHAAEREIVEETGYKNFKFTAESPFLGHGRFYSNTKNKNMHVTGKGLLYDLIDYQKGETNLDDGEKGKFKVIWEPLDKIAPMLDDGIHEAQYRYLILNEVYTGQGILTDSGQFSGMDSEKAKKEIVKFVLGQIVTRYKLRDWVFSRQRYWGEPIPVLHDGKEIVPLKEKDLPLTLPKVTSYEPTGTAESPLANIPKWINVKVGKKILKRESNTMPQWAGSSWYYLRYMDPKNNKALVDKKKEKYWNTVDLYVGGAEHATRHLIYARFWHKFLYDIGVVSTKEPFERLQNVGLIIASDGRKMSKRFGNVINPDEIVQTFGADSLRLYEMFMGPFAQSVAWGEENIVGVRRFLERVWRLQSKVTAKKVQTDEKLESLLHKTVEKVGSDIETMAFNTAVSSMMILLNEMERHEDVAKKDFEMFLKVLSPFAPHITEEIWHNIGNRTPLVTEKWPKADPKKMKESEVNIAVQINNKVRAVCKVGVGSGEVEVLKIARGVPDVDKWLMGKQIEKVIFVKDKLINIIAI